MSRVLLADAGPLYALIDRDNEHHQQAQIGFEAFTNAGLTLAVIVPIVQEAHRLLLQRIGLPVASRWLQELNDGTVIIATDLDDYRQACSHLTRYPDQRISIGDGLLMIVSQRLQVPVLSYDHHFDILGAERWYHGT